jgi:hypothetical protein
MRVFAVLILVSSLTYSVSPIKPESKCFRVGSNIQNISIVIVTLPFVSLWMFEQNGLQSQRPAKANKKKILMFY